MRIQCTLIKPVFLGNTQEVASWQNQVPKFDAELRYLSDRELDRAQSINIASEVELTTRWLSIFEPVRIRWRIRDQTGQLYEITERLRNDVKQEFVKIRAQVRPRT